MTLQQDLGGGPLFPEMEFCLLCFSLFHRIVEIDLLDGEIFNEPLPVRSSRK